MVVVLAFLEATLFMLSLPISLYSVDKFRVAELLKLECSCRCHCLI